MSSEMNKFGKKFTIFLPVKNGGNHISMCVESILSQSYSNFDLIILENKSTDGTDKWLRAMEERDSRVKVLPSESDLSIEENWSRILAIPKNQFMTIIGHDDLLEPNFLEEINSLIADEPEANLYLTHFKLINSEGKLIRHCKPIPKYQNETDFLAARMAGIRDSYGTGYVMRSEQYDRVGGIPAFSNLLYADDALWLKLMNNSYKVTSPRVCFAYRLHTGSVSGKPNPERLFDGLIKFLALLSAHGKENHELARTIDLYAPHYVGNFYCYYFLRMALQGRRVDQQKISELELLLKELAPEAVLDKSYIFIGRYLCSKIFSKLASKCDH